MEPDEYRTLKEIFLRLRALPPEERGAALRRDCGEDPERRRRLEGLLEAEALEILGPAEDDAPRPWPERLGDYRVLGVLGEGGMAVVYRARQERPERLVALKVIRPGFSSTSLLRRFELEAEVLGRLVHPGIAQIYEAGTADSGAGPQPYFAMELVDGETILEHANANDLGLRERIGLVARVCDAVEHAHRKGVIHRDLKPGNVLVDRSGQPKVLDFGVARATGADLRSATLETSPGQIVGTLGYMSPEQASGDPTRLDTRSDVYALGVVAYELLAGRSPHELQGKTLAAAVRTIVEDDAAPLSRADRRLRGDLENVVAKALHRDVEQRYASAAEFAADLRRFLADEPVLARPASATYQLRKFARRNPALVLALGAATVFLVAGFVTSTLFAVRAHERAEEAEAERQRARLAAEQAERQKERANDEAAGAREVTDFLVDLFSVSEPSRALGEAVLARDLLDRGAESIRAEPAGRRFSKARVMLAIGRAYAQLGLFAEAGPLLEGAVELRRASVDGDPLDLARSLYVLGDHHAKCGRFDDAVSTQAEALEIRRAALPEDHEDVVRSQMALGTALLGSERYAEAEVLLEEAARHAERVLAREDVHRAQVFLERGNLRRATGRYDSAARDMEKALSLWEEALPRDHPKLAEAHNSLGVLYQVMGRYEESAAEYERTLEILEKVLPPGHVNLALLNMNLAIQWADRRRFDRAEPCLERLEEIVAIGGHRQPGMLALPYAIRGRAASERGDHAAAIECHQKALELVERANGPDHQDLAAYLRSLSSAYRASGRPDAALPPLLRALRITESAYGEDHPYVALALHNLGNLYGDLEDPNAAAAAFERSLAIQDAQETRSYFLTKTLECYARALGRLGRDADAAALAARLEAERVGGE